jgi:hypothetical protein
MSKEQSQANVTRNLHLVRAAVRRWRGISSPTPYGEVVVAAQKLARGRRVQRRFAESERQDH